MSVTVLEALVAHWVTVEVILLVTVVEALVWASVAGGVQRQVAEVEEPLQGSHQVLGNEVDVEQG